MVKSFSSLHSNRIYHAKISKIKEVQLKQLNLHSNVNTTQSHHARKYACPRQSPTLQECDMKWKCWVTIFLVEIMSRFFFLGNYIIFVEWGSINWPLESNVQNRYTYKLLLLQMIKSHKSWFSAVCDSG